MIIDENEFFRKATIRLCGSLDLESALWRCLLYIRDYLPADFITMSYISKEVGGFHAIAKADLDGGEKIDIHFPLSAETISQLTDNSYPEVIIIDDPNEHPVLKHTVHHAPLSNPSIIVVRPIIDDQYLGALTIMAEGKGRYKTKHVHFLSLLREPASIALSNSLRYIQLKKLKDMLADDNRYLQQELNRQCGDEIVGMQFGLKSVMDLVHQVAPLNSAVIIYGNTGTGKEVIARAIHNLSPRRGAPFVKVNCGAIPENLVDSELFGHEKGAFTGAISQKRGRFERADSGTIFLDEIGELSLEAQVRLLRVLQENEIERVGSTKALKVDIRVLAATHRDLQKMIMQGTFREDLYFRLQVFPIVIPPLVDRMGDIPALTQHFIIKKAREMGIGSIPLLAENALNQLESYHWPGNVRELENAVERAMILSKGNLLSFDFLPKIDANFKNDLHQRGNMHTDSLEVTVREHILKALNKSGGIISGNRGAAKLLGVNPSTLRAKMRKLGIPFGKKSE